VAAAHGLTKDLNGENVLAIVLEDDKVKKGKNLNILQQFHQEVIVLVGRGNNHSIAFPVSENGERPTLQRLD
jgi:hypothetical protein